MFWGWHQRLPPVGFLASAVTVFVSEAVSQVHCPVMDVFLGPLFTDRTVHSFDDVSFENSSGMA